MSRTLLAVAIGEGLVIAGLAIALWSKAGATTTSLDPGLMSTSRESSESQDAKAREGNRDDSQAASPKADTERKSAEPSYDASLGTVLFGRVVDPEGKAIQEGHVSLRRASGTYVSASMRGGRGYSIAGLSPGEWELATRITGYKPIKRKVVILPQQAQRMDLAPKRAWVMRVAFVDSEGKPSAKSWRKLGLFVDLQCIATRDDPPARYALTTRRYVSRIGVGQWRPRFFDSRAKSPLPDRYAGVLEIDADEPLWVSAVLRQQVVAKQRVPPGKNEIEFVITPETLQAQLAQASLRVVASETSAPIEGARVSFTDRQTGTSGRPTDTDGRITITNIVPGILELVIRVKDRERYHRLLRIEPGAKLELGDVAVDPVRRFEGIVYGSNGKPAAGVSFAWYREGRYPEDTPLCERDQLTIGFRGPFQAVGLGNGSLLADRATRCVARTGIDLHRHESRR